MTLEPQAQETGAKSSPETPAAPSRFNRVMKSIFSPDAGTIAGAIVLALLIGALLVVFFNAQVQETLSYFFARPSDFFAAAGTAFSGFFTSLIRGSLFDWQASTAAGMFAPITETLVFATPLIISGLAITVAFRAGLFNIGVQGQLIFGAIFAAIVGVNLDLPPVIGLIVAILAAVIGGAIWGAIPGYLKARVGANEVIVTIMLNTIAFQFLNRLLQLPILIGDGLPSKSIQINENDWYPPLLGSSYRLHAGFIVALLAAVFVWWLLERSTFGFELRAAGENPSAAATAGINVNRVIFTTMVISGALAGLAATAPVLGTEHFLTNGTAGSFGFDAITVALLGRSRPLGTVLAGLLFGALNAGGSTMQASANIPIDIVQVTQAVIVLLIAASEARKYFKAKKAASQAVSASAKGASK
ncbi:ABC transporter permease [Boudabousia tangfeifanii]|uniref:ABC transporter permease n=1 Tax=Boudabousia tangfeifanii TaxID=1912795 RepID=A0A1D9ML07_9ACTO|nr:ABC transporter permease [Boudabousia tangfeifanii]AOZ72994.1 ABC transporter permease [Boudabousia tangfeifanii]